MNQCNKENNCNVINTVTFNIIDSGSESESESEELVDHVVREILDFLNISESNNDQDTVGQRDDFSNLVLQEHNSRLEFTDVTIIDDVYLCHDIYYIG